MQPNGDIANLTITDLDEETVSVDENRPVVGEILFLDGQAPETT